MKAALTKTKNTWQLQEAKNQLSRVVDQALEHGAQTITRHGKPVVVVLSEAQYAALVPGKPRKTLWDWIKAMPKVGPDGLNIERNREPARTITFD